MPVRKKASPIAFTFDFWVIRMHGVCTTIHFTASSLFVFMEAYATFWKSLIQNPLETGSVVPSSRRLAQLMVAQAHNLQDAKLVVELGPGTGAFTSAILDRLNAQAHFLAIERNPTMVRFLNRKFPNLAVVCDSAERLQVHLAEYPVAPDCIFCGLPLSWLPHEVRCNVLDAVFAALAPHGRFIMFQYAHSALTPLGKVVHHELRRRFRRVHSRRTLRNLPPALVFSCEK
jgi:phosphatidylethanolamine/phosphatidyl-N-methylethanolamine N-methyltransferase